MLSSKPANFSIRHYGIPAAQAARNVLFGVALVMVALSIYVPLSPIMPWESLDPSWIYGMNQALAQNLVFGRDIIFTAGPYASVYTTAYHPASDHLMLWGAIYLALSFSVVAYLNFRRSPWPYQLALLILLSALMYSRDALLFFYPLMVGVYIYKATSSVYKATSSGSLHGLSKAQALVLLAILFAPFGLFPLIKSSMLIACLAIIVFSSFFLIRADKLSYAIFAALTPAVTVVVFWLVAGQPLGALGSYFSSMPPIVSGYTEAMATFGQPKEALLFVVAALFLAWVVFRNAASTLPENAALSLMILCLLFLAFKGGYVRHDSHVLVSSTMLLMATVVAATLVPPGKTGLMFLLVLASWAYTDTIHAGTSTTNFYGNLKTTFGNAKNGIKQRISDPGKLEHDFNQRVADLKARGDIPLLNGTVDIYSYDQAHLIASGNTWNPRPILQSYSVYTPALAEKNKAHLLGPDRPDHIIFKTQPIDGRLPSLEDGPSWPILVSSYTPRFMKNGYIYLESKTDDHAPTETPLASKRRYSVGEKIELPQTDKMVFAKVYLNKSILGRLANILFKPSPLKIELTLQRGATRSYRMIAPMAQAGFVLSPVVETTEDFGLLFAGADYLDDKKVTSLSIQPTGYSMLWSNSLEIELTTIEYEQQPDVVDLYKFKAPMPGHSFPESQVAPGCDGNIDILNGASPPPASINASFLLTASGWLALSTDNGTVPDKTYLVLTATDESRFLVEAARTPRPDVGSHFNKPELSAAGFSATSDISSLDGNYTLSLAYSSERSLFLCPQFNIPINVARP